MELVKTLSPQAGEFWSRPFLVSLEEGEEKSPSDLEPPFLYPLENTLGTHPRSLMPSSNVHACSQSKLSLGCS